MGIDTFKGGSLIFVQWKMREEKRRLFDRIQRMETRKRRRQWLWWPEWEWPRRFKSECLIPSGAAVWQWLWGVSLLKWMWHYGSILRSKPTLFSVPPISLPNGCLKIQALRNCHACLTAARLHTMISTDSKPDHVSRLPACLPDDTLPILTLWNHEPPPNKCSSLQVISVMLL